MDYIASFYTFTFKLLETIIIVHRNVFNIVIVISIEVRLKLQAHSDKQLIN